jgi:hypothetical protein
LPRRLYNDGFAAKLDAAERNRRRLIMMLAMRRQKFLLALIAVGSVALIAAAQKQRRLEVQLAGIRLGSPVIDKDEAGNLKPNLPACEFGDSQISSLLPQV